MCVALSRFRHLCVTATLPLNARAIKIEKRNSPELKISRYERVKISRDVHERATMQTIVCENAREYYVTDSYTYMCDISNYILFTQRIE